MNESLKKMGVEQLRVVQAKPRVCGSRVGSIVELRNGAPIVDFVGNPLGPQAARVLGALGARLERVYRERQSVLLTFEEEDPSRPIVIDVVLDGAVAANVEEPLASIEPMTHDKTSTSAPVSVAACLGTIAAVEETGVLIRLHDGHSEPILAVSAITLRNLKDPVVLLLLADAAPVIVGQVYAKVPIEPEGGESAEVVLKGSRVTIEADVELVLKAGACMLHLDARGKAVTSANQIVSRARDSNKVQGGSVQLN